MRRSLLLAIASTTLFITGCKEDFELAAPYKDITLVYGMLDVDSVDNYVRIQKAFLSQDKSSIDMAKVSDSSFYADGAIDVKMRVLNNGNIIKSVDMPRVQVADKGAGAFFTGPNYAYRLTETLNRNYRYRLVIKNNQTGDIDSSETAIIPSDTAYVSGASGNFYVPMFGDDVYPPTPINFEEVGAGRNYPFIVQAPANSAVVEGFIRFFYWEKNTGAGTDVQKYVDYPLSRMEVPTGSVNLTYRLDNITFYEFFAAQLGPANGLIRHLDTAQMYIYASTRDFLNYASVTQMQLSASLTSNEIQPIYTNLKGKDVYGLFTSRALRWGKEVVVSGATLDALYLNPLTSATGIQPEPSDK